MNPLCGHPECALLLDFCRAIVQRVQALGRVQKVRVLRCLTGKTVARRGRLFFPMSPMRLSKVETDKRHFTDFDV